MEKDWVTLTHKAKQSESPRPWQINKREGIIERVDRQRRNHQKAGDSCALHPLQLCHCLQIERNQAICMHL